MHILALGSRENHSSGPQRFDLQRRVMVALSGAAVVALPLNDWELCEKFTVGPEKSRGHGSRSRV